MSTVGIIAEYNPFHTGHEYHIRKAKEITGCDSCIVVMSGNFVQRGEPAIFNKYDRARMAINAGADLVIELPVVYSTSSANFFSLGAVSLLDSLGVIDYLCFGSETGDIDSLIKCATVLNNENDKFKAYFKEACKQGFNNAKAKQYAMEKTGLLTTDRLGSNDTLGIEYIKALQMLSSSIKPVCITRLGSDYNDSSADNMYASALGLRNFIKNNIKNRVDSVSLDVASTNELANYDFFKYIPEINQKIFQELEPVFLHDCWSFLLYRLCEIINLSDKLEDYMDVNHETAVKIKKYMYESADVNTLLDKLYTKDTTLGHESRSLMHILLDLKKNDFEQIIANGFNYYIKVLGFNRKNIEILNRIKKSSSIPLITNPIDGEKIIKAHFEQALVVDTALNMYKKELYASEVYRIIQQNTHKHFFNHEFQEKTVIV